MTRNKAQAQTDEIDAALRKAGIDHVVTNVDKEAICYLAGAVRSQWQEAEAVQIAFDHGAESVVDGLMHPGHMPPDLEHTVHVVQTSLSNAPAHDGTYAERVLGAADLSNRLFDATGRLEIHSPVGIAS